MADNQETNVVAEPTQAEAAADTSSPATNTPAPSKTEDQASQTSPAPELSPEELRISILHQVEFYFSKENLANDPYLVSQMDRDHYVDLSIIASFGRVKALSTDLELIANSLSDSKSVALDSTRTKVKPVDVKQERNTIRLRDVHPDVTEEYLVETFKKGGFEAKDVKSDIGNCWFASFSGEDEATKALEFIRTQSYQGKNFRGGIKAETLIRSYYYSSPDPYPIPMSYYQTMMNPYMAGGINTQWGVPPVGMYQVPPTGWDPSLESNYVQRYDPKSADNYRGRGGYRGKGNKKDNMYRKNPNGKEEDFAGKRRGGARKKGTRNDQQKRGYQAPNLGPAHFPPLPTQKKAGAGGYAQPFKRYDPETILEKAKNLEIERPTDLPEDCPVVLESPNAQLELSSEDTPLENFHASGVMTLSEVVKSTSMSKEDSKKEKQPKPAPSNNNNNSSNNSGKSDSGKASAKKEVAEAAQEVETTQGNSQEEKSESSDSSRPTWSQIVKKAN